ncbi:2-oxoisovalerate dehydrogenase E2 component (dihydrolipoyl transacylase) [Paenibacillus sophorae]|uniref:Dihydrolipoamide acetyltransferase component of pyruvate dehydrogenase complex n=1 Tax=Paenibacillus sophorae TaxID=1333845 RepID=A0A1H8N9E9_9BACL|nr:dihydrolipoamide acetyltransferase family protein [Paenibacillus sophorae]QWU14730.1 2-oxo acid dehydrogenase subunit E2 [Paenibacillus sophorae]SEO26063.1 2-oxoisovalerate dehydrogenase E2 component (dihydrolipoyl transacylase) [Paenibacillus sophorae]
MTDNKKLTDVAMPQLAESLVSATIGKWLKKPGDPVEQYEPLCEVITDKVNAELPSTVDGVMGDILAEEGQTVAVGEVICRIEVSVPAAPAEAAAPARAEAPQRAAVAAAPLAAAQPAASGAAYAAQDPNAPMRARYSPAVQSLAAQHSIDLSAVPGTGLGGRVTRKDVLAFLASGPAAVTAPQSSPAPQQPAAGAAAQPQGAASITQAVSAPAPVETLPPVRHSGLHLSELPRIPEIEVESGRSEYLIDVTPIRNTIASRMRQSVSEIPHAWTMIEVDVTNLVLLRNKLKDEFKRREGINLTYLAFLMKAVVSAIKDYPIMNSVWAVDKIIVKRDINISLAVGTEDSVWTPVIKKADQKNVAGLAREIEELAMKTREGKLRVEDMQGGTFTVNNTGSFGSILSYPIINYPQAAILTFESIVKKPVVINDMIAVRSMANICLSLDHRILDGVICGRFLQRVKDNIESYSLDTNVY